MRLKAESGAGGDVGDANDLSAEDVPEVVVAHDGGAAVEGVEGIVGRDAGANCGFDEGDANAPVGGDDAFVEGVMGLDAEGGEQAVGGEEGHAGEGEPELAAELVLAEGAAEVYGEEEESDDAEGEKEGGHRAGWDDAAADAGKDGGEGSGEGDGPEDALGQGELAEAHEVAGPACQITGGEEAQGKEEDTEERLEEVPEHVARHIGLKSSMWRKRVTMILSQCLRACSRYGRGLFHFSTRIHRGEACI